MLCATRSGNPILKCFLRELYTRISECMYLIFVHFPRAPPRASVRYAMFIYFGTLDFGCMEFDERGALVEYTLKWTAFVGWTVIGVYLSVVLYFFLYHIIIHIPYLWCKHQTEKPQPLARFDQNYYYYCVPHILHICVRWFSECFFIFLLHSELIKQMRIWQANILKLSGFGLYTMSTGQM